MDFPANFQRPLKISKSGIRPWAAQSIGVLLKRDLKGEEDVLLEHVYMDASTLVSIETFQIWPILKAFDTWTGGATRLRQFDLSISLISVLGDFVRQAI